LKETLIHTYQIKAAATRNYNQRNNQLHLWLKTIYAPNEMMVQQCFKTTRWVWTGGGPSNEHGYNQKNSYWEIHWKNQWFMPFIGFDVGIEIRRRIEENLFGQKA
jgi:hypothetical protein